MSKFKELHEQALAAVNKLADYAHTNEAMEDAMGESRIALDRATFYRVKSEQALKALQELRFRS